MIRKILSVLVAALPALALAWPMPASAHWSFTRWGMTVDQVIAASGGRLARAPGAKIMGQNQQLSGVVAFEGRNYMADLFFSDDGKLTLVRLQPFGASDCPAIIAQMKARYGASASQYNGEWTDKKTGDGVGQSFSYEYTPCYTSYRKPGLPTG